MCLRNVRKTRRASGSTKGEFILEFPQKEKFNSMIPAGASIEFTYDYTIASVKELSDDGQSITGMKVVISAERYQKVYPPNNAIIYKNRVIEITATGDKQIEFANAHAYKSIAYVQFDEFDNLKDIASSYKIKNNGREIGDLRPASWRAYINDLVGQTPSFGILYHEFRTPLLSDELIAMLDIEDNQKVELYVFTQEVVV